MHRHAGHVLATVIAVIMALGVVAPASASETFPGEVKQYSKDSAARYSVKFGAKFTSIDEVWATFHFSETDPFGPGDELALELEEVWPQTSFSFGGVDGTPDVTSRSISWVQPYQDEDMMMAFFGDGKQKDMTLRVPKGSFTVTSITMMVVGTQA